MGLLSGLAKIPKAARFIGKMGKIMKAVESTQDVFRKGEELATKYRLQDVPNDLRDWMKEVEEAAADWKDLR